MIIKIAITAITGAFLTAQLKSLKPEYGQVLLIGMGVFLFFFCFILSGRNQGDDRSTYIHDYGPENLFDYFDKNGGNCLCV